MRQAHDRVAELALAEGAVAGRPHVFAVEATAIPLPQVAGRTVATELAVSLLMTPDEDAPFPLRAPRGQVWVGSCFALVVGAGPHADPLLVRAVAVTEAAGVQFDIVTAQVVRPIDRTAREHDAFGSAVAGRPAGSPAAALRDPRLRAPAPRGELAQRACAQSVELPGVPTLEAPVSVTLLTAVHVGEPVELDAPRGEIVPGVFVGLRYFDLSGAWRGVVRVDRVDPRPGMLDHVLGVLLCPPERAPERQSYRVAFDGACAIELLDRGGRVVAGQSIDVSSGGLAFWVAAPLAPEARVRVADHGSADLIGASLVIVRNHGRDGLIHGARFVEPGRGAVTVLRRLDGDEAEHRRLRDAQIEEVRRSRAATAEPLSRTLAWSFENRGMSTRRGARR